MTWIAEHETHIELLWKADDGSSVADCWVTGQVATELLGFPSLFENTQAQLQILTSRVFPVPKQGSEIEASLDQVLCMLVHCHGRITVETEGWQAETENMLWLVKGADGKTLQEEEGLILRVIMQQACQMSSLVCRFASNMLQPSSTHLFGLLTPCWSLWCAGSGVQWSISGVRE
jgi:hypothetical protein